MRMLVDTYGSYIFHLAYLYVKNKETAEEITQDILYTFHAKREQFRGEASQKTYLTRMTINRCHDELRKMKRRSLLEAVLPFMKPTRSAEQTVIGKVAGESIKEIVWSLPVYYREVIILHFYEDFTVKEMTELLGLSENTIRTRLRRAKELLKGKLSHEMEGGLLDEQF